MRPRCTMWGGVMSPACNVRTCVVRGAWCVVVRGGAWWCVVHGAWCASRGAWCAVCGVSVRGFMVRGAVRGA